jgi:hypothetical protein
MSQYDTIDRLIVEAIKRGQAPLYDRAANAEATRLAKAMGKSDYRLVDYRTQALRKAGRIAHKRWGDEKVSRWGVVEGGEPQTKEA